MTNFIPIFPLSVVVYPGEELNLHIFEPRYKQLIRECMDQGKPFGIPVVIRNKINEWGTLTGITAVSKTYENGEMDIKTRGSKVFRMLEVIREVPGKLYSGAIVNYPENDRHGEQAIMQKLLAAVKQLYRMLHIKKDLGKGLEEICSYDLAHTVGFTLQQEYELLTLMNEVHRLEYLKRHLKKVIPVLKEMEALKQKIKLNGHFRNLSGFNLS